MITIIKLREHEELAEKAAQWFHQKWGVPMETNIECMKEYLCVYVEKEYRCRAISIPRSSVMHRGTSSSAVHRQYSSLGPSS